MLADHNCCMCLYISKEDVVMKDLEVEGETEKIEESTTPTDVNVSSQ